MSLSKRHPLRRHLPTTSPNDAKSNSRPLRESLPGRSRALNWPLPFSPLLDVISKEKEAAR